jgi:hypothetical protein
MKKLIFVLAIAILLAGSAVGTMSTPSYAQGYGGYNYPPPPQNIYASPWVGSNTPWVYYNGDWFLNGILYYFFGNNYGWAPYYSYPPTYIVRPGDWYAPRWNTWYQQNPHYWQSFTQRYPYWRGHQYTQRYDQNFYNQHHRDQGGGWNQGFHGVRPPATPGPAVRTPGTTGPAVRTPGATGPAVRSPETTGPGGRTPVTPGPAVRTPGPTGPAVRTPAATGPAVRTPGPTGPAVQQPAATGPGAHAPAATSPGGAKPGTTAPGGGKPGKTPPDEEKKQ